MLSAVLLFAICRILMQRTVSKKAAAWCGGGAHVPCLCGLLLYPRSTLFVMWLLPSGPSAVHAAQGANAAHVACMPLLHLPAP